MASDSLDTNLIIHYLIGDNPKQYAAVEKHLQSATTHYVEDIAISEAVYVLDTVYHRTRQQTVKLLNFFFTRFSHTLTFNRDIPTAVFPFYLAHPKLSFNDCLLSVCAESHHAEPLFTFDKKLARQAENAKLLI